MIPLLPILMLCATWLMPLASTTQPAAGSQINPSISSPAVIGSGGYATEENREGDLIVDGGETYVIENKALFIDGNIIVKENSTLEIKNSKIILQLKFFGEYWVEIRDGSRLLVNNSILERTGGHLTLLMIYESEATIRNTVCGWDIDAGGEIILENYDASSARNGIFFVRGNVTVIDSKIFAISIHNISGSQKYTVELENLRTGLIDHLLIERDGGDYSLELTNTTVDRWVIDAGDPVNPSFVDVVARNSEIWGLWIWFCPGTNVELSNIKPGIHPHWRMSDVWHLDGVGYDIELENTTIEMFKLQILGNARIENASGIQVATRGSSFAHVKNSVIEVNLILRGNEHVILENTEVRGGQLQLVEDRSALQDIIGRGGNPHRLEFRKAVINAPIEIASEFTKIEGEVTFLTGLKDINWVFGKVEREYPLIVKDEHGRPLPNVPIDLVDPGGEVIWSGTTDNEGEAFLSLEFTKENYTNEWKLRATIEGKSISKGLNFLISTPIVLSPTAPDGIPVMYIVVGIVAIVVAAGAALMFRKR